MRLWPMVSLPRRMTDKMRWKEVTVEVSSLRAVLRFGFHFVALSLRQRHNNSCDTKRWSSSYGRISEPCESAHCVFLLMRCVVVVLFYSHSQSDLSTRHNLSAVDGRRGNAWEVSLFRVQSSHNNTDYKSGGKCYATMLGLVGGINSN